MGVDEVHHKGYYHGITTLITASFKGMDGKFEGLRKAILRLRSKLSCCHHHHTTTPRPHSQPRQGEGRATGHVHAQTRYELCGHVCISIIKAHRVGPREPQGLPHVSPFQEHNFSTLARIHSRNTFPLQRNKVVIDARQGQARQGSCKTQRDAPCTLSLILLCSICQDLDGCKVCRHCATFALAATNTRPQTKPTFPTFFLIESFKVWVTKVLHLKTFSSNKLWGVQLSYNHHTTKN